MASSTRKAGEVWAARPGWEHRAFAGAGPFTEEAFAAAVDEVAAASGWGPEERAARVAQGYVRAGDEPAGGAELEEGAL